VWIPRQGERSLLVFEPDGTLRAEVDLASFADGDGIPDMSAIAIVDGVAYVALRRLENGVGTRTNKPQIVAIDVKTRAASSFVELPVKNPGTKLLRQGGTLWLSCMGAPSAKDALGNPDPDRDAGLVRIDLAARTATVALSADAAQGFVTAFALDDENTGYALVGGFDGDHPTSLVRFDPTAGKLLDATPWARTSGAQLSDLTMMTTSAGDALLLVADGTDYAPGLRVLSARDGARLGFIPTPFPPLQQIVLRSPS
jgi:hypothetical protein